MIQGRKVSNSQQMYGVSVGDLHSRKVSPPSQLQNDVEVPFFELTKLGQSSTNSKPQSRQMSRQESLHNVLVSPTKSLAVQEPEAKQQKKKRTQSHSQVINLQQQIIIQPLQNQQIMEMGKLPKPKKDKKKKKKKQSKSKRVNSPSKLQIAQPSVKQQCSPEREQIMQILQGTSIQKFKLQAKEEKQKKEEEKQKQMSLQDFKRYMDYQVRQMNQKRFTKQKGSSPTDRLPWGINQSKLKDYWGKMIMIHQKLSEGTPQVAPKTREPDRRQDLGLGFLNQLPEPTVNSIIKKQKQCFEKKQQPVQKNLSHSKSSSQNSERLKQFIQAKQAQWRQKDFEKKYSTTIQEQQRQLALKLLSEEIKQKQRQISVISSNRKQLLDKPSAFNSNSSQRNSPGSKKFQRKTSQQQIPGYILDKESLDKHYQQLQEEYSKIFNWRTLDVGSRRNSNIVSASASALPSPKLESNEFIEWLQSLPESFLEEQLIQMQTINEQMNAQGFNYILSEAEQYQFLEQFLKEKYKRHKQDLNQLANQPQLKSTAKKKSVEQRYNQLQQRWLSAADQYGRIKAEQYQGQVQEQQMEEYMEMLRNAAATMIQKVWRGYYVRRIIQEYRAYAEEYQSEPQLSEVKANDESSLNIFFPEADQPPPPSRNQQQHPVDIKDYSQSDYSGYQSGSIQPESPIEQIKSRSDLSSQQRVSGQQQIQSQKEVLSKPSVTKPSWQPKGQPYTQHQPQKYPTSDQPIQPPQQVPQLQAPKQQSAQSESTVSKAQQPWFQSKVQLQPQTQQNSQQQAKIQKVSPTPTEEVHSEEKWAQHYENQQDRSKQQSKPPSPTPSTSSFKQVIEVLPQQLKPASDAEETRLNSKHELKQVLGAIKPPTSKVVPPQTSGSLVTIQELNSEVKSPQTNMNERLSPPLLQMKSEQIEKWDSLVQELSQFKQSATGNDLQIRALSFIDKLQQQSLLNLQMLNGEEIIKRGLEVVVDQSEDNIKQNVEQFTQTEAIKKLDQEDQTSNVSVAMKSEGSKNKDSSDYDLNVSFIFTNREQALEMKYQKQFEIMERMLENKKVSVDSFQNNYRRLDRRLRKEKEKLKAQKSDLERVQQLFRETIKQTKRDQQFIEKIRRMDHSFREEENFSLKQFLSLRSDTEQSEPGEMFQGQFITQRTQQPQNQSTSSIEQRSQSSPRAEQLSPTDLHVDYDKETLLTLEDQQQIESQRDHILIQTEAQPEELLQLDHDKEDKLDFITDTLLYAVIEEFAAELNAFPISSLGVLMEWDEESEGPTSQLKSVQGFPTTLNFVKDHLIAFNEFLQRRYMPVFLQAINTPLGISPLELLKTISLSEMSTNSMDESQSGPLYPLIKHIHMMEPVIDEEVWEQFCLEQCSQGKLKYALCNDNEAMKESEQCHLRMVYEAFNEALNYIRPYGIRGQPYPWLSNPLKAYQHVTTLSNYEKAMGFAIAKMLKWGAFLCGFIPEKIETPQGEIILIEEDYLNQIKEDRLQQMIENEIQESEEKWLAYEEELTEVCVELADIVFESMLDETSEDLLAILLRR